MKKILSALLCAGILAGLITPVRAEEAPAVSAQAAILMEAESGQLLYEKNADDPRLIASTTKIMTALVVLENCELDREVVIESAWTGIEGSSMYLEAGQKMTVRELLYGLMLASGNDAAVALACITAGSVEAFAARMNEKAQELGCENTHFMNPNGLDHEEHYASARDLALITREAISHEAFCEIVSSISKTVGELTFTNHNRLLRECKGVFGVKTGYTAAAGRTLVTACEREGLTLICVTLSAPDDWQDHQRLYDWAYGQWGRFSAVDEEACWTVPVIGGEAEEAVVCLGTELSVFCRAGEEITLTVELPSFVHAPVQAGAVAGRVTAWLGEQELGFAPLLYQETIEKTAAEKPTLGERVAEFFRFAERNVYVLS